jgi:hypothetical protein
MEKITYYTNSGEFIADKLLPCPFCGGEPEFITIGNYHTKSRKAQIECTKCHVRRTTGTIRNDLEWCGRKAIEAWNARWQDSSDESAALPLHDVSASLLKKYMTLIIDCEGVDFLYKIDTMQDTQEWTDEEVEALTELSESISNAR